MAVLSTIAILIVGCFVVFAAVQAIAFISDGSRKTGAPLAPVRSRSARRVRTGKS
jgi:hypothetical protein